MKREPDGHEAALVARLCQRVEYLERKCERQQREIDEVMLRGHGANFEHLLRSCLKAWPLDDSDRVKCSSITATYLTEGASENELMRRYHCGRSKVQGAIKTAMALLDMHANGMSAK